MTSITQQKLCKHNAEFRFLACEAADRFPGVWVCGNGCGYYLLFDPSLFPKGIVYLQEPEVGKKSITILSSKKG